MFGYGRRIAGGSRVPATPADVGSCRKSLPWSDVRYFQGRSRRKQPLGRSGDLWLTRKHLTLSEQPKIVLEVGQKTRYKGCPERLASGPSCASCMLIEST